MDSESFKILQKLKHYCGYQERCHAEVVQKLYELGSRKKDHDDIIAALIEENYLNEERFAIAYARGKWRMKQWGRNRIRYELKQRKISDYLIRKAMKEIDEDEYLSFIGELTKEKYKSLKSDQYMIRKKKTIDYMISRGFETELVLEAIKEIAR